MKPYYSDKWVTIYHGDCREILPQLDVKVDLVLTDPPYGRDEIKNNPSRGKLAVSKDYGLGEWDKEPPDKVLLDTIIARAKHSILFGGNYFELPPSSCWLVWDKDNQGNDFADCELAWTNFDTAVRKYLWRWNGMLQEPNNPKDHRCHPTQKPSGLFSLILADYSKEGDTILDPFRGLCTKSPNFYHFLPTFGTTAYSVPKVNEQKEGKSTIYELVAKLRYGKTNIKRLKCGKSRGGILWATSAHKKTLYDFSPSLQYYSLYTTCVGNIQVLVVSPNYLAVCLSGAKRWEL